MKAWATISGACVLLWLAVFVPHFSREAAPSSEVATGASEPRSHDWPAVRAAWLKDHGVCAACGQNDHLNVHHVVPFHADPSKELDPTNLITLCTDGPGHLHCHLVIGHAGNFRCHNERVREDAAHLRALLEGRSCD